MALRNVVSQTARVVANPSVTLYRSMIREVPRVLHIYDIEMPVVEAKAAVRSIFATNAAIEDERVIDMHVQRGYMELEETLYQYKQKAQLLRLLLPKDALGRGGVGVL